MAAAGSRKAVKEGVNKAATMKVDGNEFARWLLFIIFGKND